jgi:hypothetical protein
MRNGTGAGEPSRVIKHAALGFMDEAGGGERLLLLDVLPSDWIPNQAEVTWVR